MTSRAAPLVVALALLVLGPGCALFSGLSASPKPPTPEQRREAYLREHPETDPTIAAAISEGAVAEGMTPAELQASLGQPWSREAGQNFGDENWYFEVVAYGTHTEFAAGGPSEERTFSGVRELKVSLIDDRVMSTEDLGYQTRDQFLARCQQGSEEACNRLARLDAQAREQ